MAEYIRFGRPLRENQVAAFDFRKEANKMPTSTGDFSLKQWREVHEFLKMVIFH